MNTPPAIAVFEFDSIPVGVCAADAMVKKARIDVLRIGTVQPGKYIILIGGTVGDVGESRREGLRVGGERVTDEIFLPDVHTQVFAAVGGHRQDNAGDALGIIETSAIPINVAAADKAVKTAQVTIVEIRLGDGLGGKGITMLIPIQDRELRARIQAATELYPSGDGTRDQPTAGKRASRR
jgi:microcompartment protein CcmL/EutN